MTDRARILVVDDEMGPRESLRMILKPRHDIATADSGEAALQTLKTFHPDLMFMDIKMPQMDGIELLRRVKAIDPSIEVVMITAYASLETVKNALTHGAFEYLIKPFSRQDLEDTTRRALARRQTELGTRSQLTTLVDEMRSLSSKTRTLEEEARREQAEQSLRVTQLSILREISRGILGQLDLTQLTTDGGTKIELQWTPDGQSLVYISGLCVKMLNLANGQITDVVCFEYTGTTIEEFEISPDGSHAAISVNQELYIVPFDLAKLKEVDRPSKIKALSDCASMAPFASSTGSAFAVLSVRWSQDMHQMAIMMKIIYGQQQEDAVRLMDITNCDARPTLLDEFPSTRFRIGQIVRLENIAFDGFYNFALIGIERNEGFGDLYFYN